MENSTPSGSSFVVCAWPRKGRTGNQGKWVKERSHGGGAIKELERKMGNSG